MRILILGVTGMLGSTAFKTFTLDSKLEVFGTLRSKMDLCHFPDAASGRLLMGTDVLDQDKLANVLDQVKPDVVINCIGLIKQLADAKDPLLALPVNAILPHRLARLCSLARIRMIHISTDCVFSGRKGNYLEEDKSDAEDLYGKSKYIGELHDLSHVVTLRTSIIGHELKTNFALVDWFLSQEKSSVQGFSKAIFSGLPTVELARVMKDFVLPRPHLSGLYHVAARPISKFDLLRLIASRYNKKIEIQTNDSLVIDRSLNGKRFSLDTGYQAPEWPELIARMHAAR